MMAETTTYPDQHLRMARELSWRRFGKKIFFYLPGIFSVDGHTGQYPAVSITGKECAIKCDHCQGQILTTMDDVSNPQLLVDRCRRLAEKNVLGVLISGGCDGEGKLPWKPFLPAIRRIKEETDLLVSVHCGIVNDTDAQGLKQAGVDQALIDLIGDNDTFQQIYHVPFGVERIEASLASLIKAKLSVVPHIVCGLYYGRISGECRAIEMLKPYNVNQVVFVSLMGIPYTPMWKVLPPEAEAVAKILASARLALPDTLISLGCARQRGNVSLEKLAIDAGVNRMALPSEEAIQHAKDYGLDFVFQKTCCSVEMDIPTEPWLSLEELQSL